MSRLIRGLHNLPPFKNGCVLTIGNFDGIHIGHQALLAKTIEVANRAKLPSVVMVFEPQPQEFLINDLSQIPPRLTRLREKCHILAKSAIDYILVVNFNQKLASYTADLFIENVLIQGLNAKHVMLGRDFRFGKNREGNIEYLEQHCKKSGIKLCVMADFTYNDERVSSTRIRKALNADDQSEVKRLLGRPYSMEGRIIHGSQLGRKLGFPTANIFVHRKVSPIQGIYIVKVHGINSKGLPGVANIGIRPAVDGKKTLLEIYLFHFSDDIYRKYVTVEFIKKLRDEEYYPNLDLLKAQIAIDADNAHNYFKRTGEL